MISAGVLTGLLYYFGYTRERAVFTHFGISLGTLDLTSSDYVLRSAEAVFSPLVAVLLLGLLALVAHHGVRLSVSGGVPRGWRPAWVVTAVISVGLLGVGAAGLFIRPEFLAPRVSAIALALGAVLLEYAVWMSTSDIHVPAAVRDTIKRSLWQRRTLLAGIALVGAFWWTAIAANQNGNETARAIELSLEQRSEAVVLSDERLGILRGEGVTVDPLPKGATGYAFRYLGFRVLVASDDTWFLIPRGWTRENGDTIVLLPRQAEGIRVDIRP